MWVYTCIWRHRPLWPFCTAFLFYHKTIQRTREPHVMFKKKSSSYKQFYFRFRFDWSRIIFSGDHFTLINFKTVRLQIKDWKNQRAIYKRSSGSANRSSTLFRHARPYFEGFLSYFLTVNQNKDILKNHFHNQNALGIWLLTSGYSSHTFKMFTIIFVTSN